MRAGGKKNEGRGKFILLRLFLDPRPRFSPSFSLMLGRQLVYYRTQRVLECGMVGDQF